MSVTAFSSRRQDVAGQATEVSEPRRRIEAYYDQTWNDYRFLWLNRQNLAFHFGYHDATTHSHAAALLNTNRTLAARAAIQAGHRVFDAGCSLSMASTSLACWR